MFDLLMLMAHKQYVTVMFNKRRYTSDIAVFDMFTVILPNIFNFFSRPRYHSMKLLSIKRCDIFPLGDYRSLQ